MIDLAKFKNIEGNEKNRSEITQIGVLEAIDAYFEGDTLFSEEQIQKMVESNITKCEVYAQLAKEETEEPAEPTPASTEPTSDPNPDPNPDSNKPIDDNPQDVKDGNIEVL